MKNHPETTTLFPVSRALNSRITGGCDTLMRGQLPDINTEMTLSTDMTLGSFLNSDISSSDYHITYDEQIAGIEPTPPEHEQLT